MVLIQAEILRVRDLYLVRMLQSQLFWVFVVVSRLKNRVGSPTLFLTSYQQTNVLNFNWKFLVLIKIILKKKLNVYLLISVVYPIV